MRCCVFQVTGCTALMAAVTAGSVALVKAILQKGVDPNKVNKNGLNSVHIAAAKGNIEASSSLRFL